MQSILNILIAGLTLQAFDPKTQWLRQCSAQWRATGFGNTWTPRTDHHGHVGRAGATWHHARSWLAASLFQQSGWTGLLAEPFGRNRVLMVWACNPKSSMKQKSTKVFSTIANLHIGKFCKFCNVTRIAGQMCPTIKQIKQIHQGLASLKPLTFDMFNQHKCIKTHYFLSRKINKVHKQQCT